MAAAVMPRRRNNGAALVIIAVVVAITAVGVLLVRNQQHADAKHSEASTIRRAYRDKLCTGVGFYYSITRGTALVLCELPGSELVGGMIFRITENGGQHWLGDDIYEASCFAARREYWQRVIERDGYVGMTLYPEIEGAFLRWLGGAL